MTTMVCAWPKAVPVREYTRTRHGKVEHVRSHCRSYPNR